MNTRSGRLWHRLVPVLLAAVLATAAFAQPADEAFLASLAELREAGFADKEAIAGRLLESQHRSVAPVLTALLEDRLYATADGKVVVLETADAIEGTAPITVLDPASMKPSGKRAPADLTRIGTNNRLRRYLRISVARFALASADEGVRLAAVEAMARSLDESTVELLTQRRPSERSSRVRTAIDTALALATLDSGDRTARLAAIETLSGRRSTDVRNRLAALVEAIPPDSEGDDADVRAAAVKALQQIDAVRSLYSGVETLFFGLGMGSVLVLAAIGLAITFGVMGVINMAHGELMMLGAYTTYVVQLLVPSAIGWSVPLAVPAAFVVAGLTGVLLERTVIRFLYGRPLETLLATFGVSLVLQQLVRSVFTANNRAVETPGWMSGVYQVNDALALTYNRLYIIVFTMAVFTALWMVLKHTRIGLQIRAVAQNRGMARAMGIRSTWVDAATFGLGSGIAGVAGVALSQLTNVGPNLGQAYIIDSFMVVVFGGVGNLWGTLIGGMSLGIVNQVLEPYAGAVLGKILVLVALILFIQRRPRGLFPQTGRAAEGA